MISLDGSIIPAIILFLVLVFALDSIIFKPLAGVLAERWKRTSGAMMEAQAKIENQMDLFGRYQASIKNARMEGYRRQDELRKEAMAKGSELLAQARNSAELLVRESRESIQAQFEAAREQLAHEARLIAGTIASRVLGRQDADTDNS
jgi:F-type H+-transporting ATPase subunit b